MSDERRLGRLAFAAFVAGVLLMVPFESTITRVLGLLCLFGFIVVGLFAVATPTRLGEPVDSEHEDG